MSPAASEELAHEEAAYQGEDMARRRTASYDNAPAEADRQTCKTKSHIIHMFNNIS